MKRREREDFAERLSAAACCYRYDGDVETALKLEMILHKLDHYQPVRVIDLEAAQALVDGKLAADGFPAPTVHEGGTAP